MDVFDLELELSSSYSSMISSASSLPELEEVSTPLLYDSVTNSYEEQLIESLDLSPVKTLSFPSITIKSTVPVKSEHLDETISKGTNTLKNNYKLWLMNQS